MPVVLKSTPDSGSTSFEPHPPGSFLAVLADVFVKATPNKYKGQIMTMGKNKGKPDDREFIEKVCFAFLTEEPIEIDGELKPRYASYWASAGLGTAEYPSNARKFLKGWWPTLTDAIIDAGLDLDRFVGKGAYITITNSPDKNDPSKVWSNVVGAMQPPKGSTIPLIPADFVRHDAKAQQSVPAPVAAPATQPVQPTQKMAAPDLKLQQQQARHAPPLTEEENSLPALDQYEAAAPPSDDDILPF
jgi:hypothetical protein